MGIVKRQGAKHSALRYIGVIIGAISTLFIYPLNRDLYGFAQFLIGAAFLMYPLANWGIATLSVKYFPRFNEESRLIHSFFNKLLVYTFSLFAVFTAIMLLLKESIIGFLKDKDFTQAHLLDEYYGTILIICLLTILIILVRQQAMNFKRIVIPSAIVEFGQKIFLPTCIIASLYVNFSFELYSVYAIVYNVVIFGLLLYYLYRLDGFGFAYVKNLFHGRVTKSELINYASFNNLSRIGTVVAFRIDAFMITLMLGAASNGLYYIFLFMANTIEIPFQSMSQISAPIISGAWERNDTKAISDIYKKVAMVLLIISISMFLFLYFSLPQIIQISPKADDLMTGLSLFLFLGLARVSDSITSVNESVLVYSKFYRWNVLFIILLAGLNIYLNYTFIQTYGLVGAAMATLVAYTVFNAVKLVFIWVTCKMHPFSKGMLVLIPFVSLTLALLFWSQNLTNPIVTFLLNGMIVFFCFLAPSLWFKLSPDLNDLLVKTLEKVMPSSALIAWLRKNLIKE